MPRFSIIIPCRDAAAALPDALASLRAQSFTDWEALCIEDGSADDTADVIERVARVDARVIRLNMRSTDENGGPGMARNEAAMAARGEILAFLDAADGWGPEHLARLAARFDAVDAPDAAFGAPDGPAPAAPCVLDALTGAPQAALSGVAVRAETFRRTGGFDARLPAAEDAEWLVRLLAAAERPVCVPGAAPLLGPRADCGAARLKAVLRGWSEAVETARIFGVAPSEEALDWAEARLRRRLAMRAFRAGAGGAALGLALGGLMRSPTGFLSAPGASGRARAA